jgi:hypothetical protein
MIRVYTQSHGTEHCAVRNELMRYLPWVAISLSVFLVGLPSISCVRSGGQGVQHAACWVAGFGFYLGGPFLLLIAGIELLMKTSFRRRG